jgi:uracil-DNA glycosylase
VSWLRALVPAEWQSALEAVWALDEVRGLERFLEAEQRQARVFPPADRIFEALARTPPRAVRVVLLGQDPYPTQGHANGLAFSVNPGVKLPPSLRNVFKGLQVELGGPLPTSGDLSPWADRGVLLLNTVLTVREGEANSHRRHGWEAVTQAIMQHVVRQPPPVVFLCFGKPAARLAAAVTAGTAHPLVTTPHPSPLNGNAFVETTQRERPFSTVNALLVSAGRPPVDFSLTQAAPAPG